MKLKDANHETTSRMSQKKKRKQQVEKARILKSKMSLKAKG